MCTPLITLSTAGSTGCTCYKMDRKHAVVYISLIKYY